MCCTEASPRFSNPTYESTMLESVADREERAGKNQLSSLQQLCEAYATGLPSSPLQVPNAAPLELLRMSLLFAEPKFKSTRLSVVPLAKNVPEPISLSEPRLRVTFPVRVTSVTGF